MSDSDFFSQATSFVSAAQGGVDPRTGLFGFSLPLGTLSGNRQLGPHLPLMLSYSPLTTTDWGFGVGFSLNVSTFDTGTGRLSLATGEQYMVQTLGNGTLNILQKKLDSFHFEKQGGSSYRVTHKSGDIEILAGSDNGGSLKLPTCILSPAGHCLTLATETHGNLNRLVGASDNSGELLLSVRYDDSASTVTFTFLPGKSESWKMVLTTNSGRLIKVVRQDAAQKEPPLTWTFQYSNMEGKNRIWGYWLTGVNAPGGSSTVATYRTDGNTHKYPDSAPQTLRDNPMPYVISVVQNPGSGQPAMTQSYTYSAQNFLGYNSGVSWDAIQDNLYHCMTDYKYSSTVTHTDEKNVSTVVTRTYNNYHLMTSQITTTGDTHELKIETEYYAVVGKDFSQQLPYFQYPKSVTTTWTDKTAKTSRQEVTTSTFDSFGNPTGGVAPDGTTTTIDYYPAAGVSGQCPPEPNGFTRFVRAKTVTPPEVTYDKPPAVYSVPPQKTTYEYTSAMTYKSTDHQAPTVKGLVVQSHVRSYSGEVLLSHRQINYEAKNNDDAGRQTGSTSTHYPAGASSKSYTTTTALTWTDKPGGENERIQVTRTITSCDASPISITSSAQLSRYTGRVQVSTDIKNRVTAVTYDSLGRKLTHTVMKGDKNYEATEFFTYELDEHAVLPYAVTHTDVLGNKTRASLDGLGRHVQTDISNVPDNSQVSGNQDTAGSWSTMLQIQHDKLGRTKTFTMQDYSTPGASVSTSLTQAKSWDNWGRDSVSLLSDGTESHTVYDPTQLTSRSWHKGTKDGKTLVSGSVLTWFDKHHRPFKTEMYENGVTTAYSTTYQQYDGLGRLRSTTDALMRTTTHQYDNWGRALKTTLPDGTIILRTFDDASPSPERAVRIAVLAAGEKDESKAKILGSRTFDGTGRLTTTTTGGRTTQYTYQSDADSHPRTVTLPDGTEQTFTYNVPLGDLPDTVNAGNIRQTFTYDKLSGALTNASERIVGAGINTLNTTYWPSGYPNTTTATIAGQPARTTTTTSRTVAGAPKTFIDYAGVSTTLTRDSSGRITGSTDTADGISTTKTYDALGRQDTHTTSVTGYNQVTTLTLDDFGRETIRVIRDSKGVSTQIEQSWTVNNQVWNRITTQNGLILRNEKYTYDERNRLKTYTCSTEKDRTVLPQDSLGYILGQRYTYDLVGNILTCVTTYDGSPGSNTVTYNYDNPNDPCQLTGYVPTTGGDEVKLPRDACGRVTTDEAGRVLGYDALGRLNSLKLKGETTAGSYGYDAHNRLVSQSPAANPVTTSQTNYYLGNRLNVVKKGTNATPVNEVRLSGEVQRHTGDDKPGVWVTGSDSMGSILSAITGSKREEYRYSPFGESNVTAGAGMSGAGNDIGKEVQTDE
ncbi:RHS repeat domain-containing protein [Enterobacter kobei]|uniref:RHS repeat domain-containing protein n=1 Tax=Enterobacter kobei TaxID=208224 RepID=UPI003CE67471